MKTFRLLSVICPAGVGALLLAGCQENSQAPSERTRAPVGKELLEPATRRPVDLVYVCGNKFLATNATRVPVRVSYRVVGTDETGSLSLRPGTQEDEGSSETELETVERGAVELYQDEERLTLRHNEGVPCGASPPGASFGVAASAVSAGKWTAPFPWANVAVHLSLLPTGKVLSFGLSGTPQVWDPGTGNFASIPSPAVIFCGGHSFLADGRLLVSGGNNDPTKPANGIPDNTIFDPGAQSWSRATAMRYSRWYPTNTTLANGDVVIISGKDEVGNTVRYPEVWSSGTLRVLTGAGLSLNLYPRAFQAPNGKVFVAGESSISRYLDPTGSGSWTTVATRRYGQRDYGAAVMYDDGKILYVGGGRTTNTAETIDLNSGAPVWQWTGSMAFPRRHLNATVLPTGEVLVTGGSRGTTFNDPKAPVYAAELWNPASGLWTTLASNAITRVYHSTSILLPDGRVLNAGSGDAGPDQRNAELFSPPYLFKGARPSVTAAPTLVGYGTRFTVSTPQAADIAQVSLIRLGSTTHAFDMNQRFQWLSFTRQTGELSIAAPTDPNRAPPGHYMVFILDGHGVPSVARILKLDRVTAPAPPPTSPLVMRAIGKVDGTKQYMTVIWTGGTSPMVSIYRDGALLKTIATTAGRYTASRTSIAPGRFVFHMCEAATTTCTNPATVRFSGTAPLPTPLGIAAWTDPTRQIMDLAWSGLPGTTVDVYRNGSRVKTTTNTGRYTNTRTFLGPATYTFKACNAGTTTCSGQATVQFDAGSPPPNALPVARFSTSCTGLGCAFTDASSDSDGSVVKWQWTFGDGSSSTLQNPSHAYTGAGTYTVALTVTDNAQGVGSTSTSVTVTEPPPPPNQPPVANFTWSCTGLTCSFTDGSTDDGSVAGWAWDFGDQSGGSTERNPSYTYAGGGSYSVSLTVTDDAGLTGSVKAELVVTAP